MDLQLFGHPSFTGTSGALANGSSFQTAFYSFTIPAAGGFVPNGNILAGNDTVNGNWVYTYDAFNRLSSAVAAGKSLGCGWVYDRYGNRWQQNPYTGTCGSDQRTYTMNGAATNNNRLDGASFDALGNLLANPSGGGSYVYDAESHLISAGGLKYIYDAEGRRVAKLSGTTVTNEYLFDTDGNQQIGLNGSGTVLHTNLYAGGKLIATYNGNDTYFHFTDWLGTRRYDANSAGAQVEICTNFPFGDSQSCIGTLDATEHHFTGKEHDTESGLDYFGARYYANVLGRFLTPDWAAKPTAVPYATFGNPQSLNLYGYVADSPILHFDPDGHCWPVSACAEAVIAKVNQIQQKVENKAIASGHPALAAAATFTTGVARDLVNGVVGLGTVGKATGTCLGGNGCGAVGTAKAVGGDLLKAAAIATAAAGAVMGSGTVAASETTTVTVTHFTSEPAWRQYPIRVC